MAKINGQLKIDLEKLDKEQRQYVSNALQRVEVVNDKEEENILYKNLFSACPWYINSSERVKNQICGLKSECNGFLNALLQRPLIAGGMYFSKIVHIFHSPSKIFGLFLICEVISLETGESYLYEFHSWKQGKYSGEKGIICLKNKSNKITHLVIKEGFRFAPAENTFDCVGGFRTGSRQDMSKNIFEELESETGIVPDEVENIIHLGNFLVDTGITNNKPEIYCAIVKTTIDGLDLGHQNTDRFEPKSNTHIVPVEYLMGPNGFIIKNPDSFFSVILLRMFALGIIEL